MKKLTDYLKGLGTSLNPKNFDVKETLDRVQGKMLSPTQGVIKPSETQWQMDTLKAGGGNPAKFSGRMDTFNQPPVQPTQVPTAPSVAPLKVPDTQDNIEVVPGAFYDAVQKYSKAYNIPPEYFYANSRWEHRGNPDWSKGIYPSNIWENPAEGKGEESYGPYQINMWTFGEPGVQKGRIKPDHPDYFDKDRANDPWASTEWQAKKWDRERKAWGEDWNRILQFHNPGESGRGENVINLSKTKKFVRGE